MLIQLLSLAIGIWLSFLVEESQIFSEKELWARIGWEILPEETPKLKLPSPPPRYCLPFPLEKVCCSLSTFIRINNSMLFLSTLGISLTLMVLFWTAYRRWTKRKRDVETDEHLQGRSIPGMEQILAELLTTVVMLKRQVEEMNKNNGKGKCRCSYADRKAEAEGERRTSLTLPVCPPTPRPSLESVHAKPGS
ncbi:testis-expressed protein 50-like isoform X2 [Ornithorhynchus anatinus]|uniref:testis-expressed protein 50-like isoform X2 n=1 Tax=Ornithorhynchus anatinus TaxID=9258 RepID=UPI0010A896CC|nr:testis-expressed protein 50-like isoform X2 [Ornithorhynchus anatinus]